MENNLLYYEQCLQYFKGEASLELEKEILAAKELEAEKSQIFEETKLLYEGFRIQKVHQEAKQLFVPKNNTHLTFYKMALAASIVIVGLIGYMGMSTAYFPDFKPQTSILMSPSAQPKVGEATNRENPYELFVRGKGRYDAQKFEEAIVIFEKSLLQPNLRNQLKEAIQWHQCVSLLRAGRVDEAGILFKELDQIENPKYEIGFLSKLKIRFQLFLKTMF